MIPAIVFSATFLSYLLTVAPTLSFFDSGEMIAGAYTLGIAHPPGYPVYVTLGKLFTFLPFGNVAYRMNLLSAFFASMASVMVYYVTRGMLEEEGSARALPGFKSSRFGIPEAAGIFSALAFGLSYTLWAWAVVSKFYTLNAFVVACILMLLVRWKRARKDTAGKGGHSLAYTYLIAFICGLAGAVHISQFVLMPVYLLFILIVDRRVFLDESPSRGKRPSALDFVKGVQIKTVLIMAFFFIFGHSVFLHLPVRAIEDPLINWGGSVNWEQFRWTYNREGYPTVGGDRTLPLFWLQLQSFDMAREFGWAGIPLVLGGAYAHFRKDWRNAVLLAGGAAFMTSVIIFLGNPPKENIFLLEQFYIPVYILLAVLMGGAVSLILKMRASAAWLLGLSFSFIFIGELPTAYIESGFKAGSVKTSLMGMEYPPALYFLFFALITAAITAGTIVLIKGRLGTRPSLFLAVVLVLFVLYPAYQLKMHYWQNDRKDNYIAFDMGNAELTFAPEFTVLFTWGDSGAFPMWYLQFVEHKRPDVLLVHTPHLPLDWFLYSIKRTPAQLGDASQVKDDWSLIRNYNGIHGVEQILQVPPEFRDPSMIIREIIKYNPEREFAFDYSSRYSVSMPFPVEPYGIIYRKEEPMFVEDNIGIWRFLVTRGLPNPAISLDLDEQKAVHIYGYVHSDLGRRYMGMGIGPMAEQEFVQAISYAPDLWSSLAPYMK